MAKRPLERVYPVVFVDGLRVAVRTDKGVLKKCVYTVLAVGFSSKQEVLGLWIEETEGARSWLQVFNDLKARGCRRSSFSVVTASRAFGMRSSRCFHKRMYSFASCITFET